MFVSQVLGDKSHVGCQLFYCDVEAIDLIEMVFVKVDGPEFLGEMPKSKHILMAKIRHATFSCMYNETTRFLFHPTGPFIDLPYCYSVRVLLVVMLDYGRNTQPPPEDWSKLLPRNERVEK